MTAFHWSFSAPFTLLFFLFNLILGIVLKNYLQCQVFQISKIQIRLYSQVSDIFEVHPSVDQVESKVAYN